MNCKPGDLAVIVAAPVDPEHIGKFVTCINSRESFSLPDKVVWYTDPELFGDDGRRICWADEHLRPIRPGETPEESTEAMKRLHDTSVPAKKKEPVVRPFQWEEL